jgi:lipoprotein-anchoring transpeptidase ErfK/SrfK
MRVVLPAVVVAAALAVAVAGGANAEPAPAAVPGGPTTGSLVEGAAAAVRDQGVPGPEVSPCPMPVRACVNLSTDQAWLLEKGKIVRGPVPIMQGDVDSPTPRGSFKVQWKAEQYTSREFLVQMPWAVFFADGGIAFHAGTPGTNTAGCVKLGDDDAQAFFEYLQVGDPVQII